MTTAAHTFLLINMAEQMVGRQQRECVEQLVNRSACYVNMFGLCRLDIFLGSLCALPSFTSMRPFV